MDISLPVIFFSRIIDARWPSFPKSDRLLGIAKYTGSNPVRNLDRLRFAAWLRAREVRRKEPSEKQRAAEEFTGKRWRKYTRKRWRRYWERLNQAIEALRASETAG